MHVPTLTHGAVDLNDLSIALHRLDGKSWYSNLFVAKNLNTHPCISCILPKFTSSPPSKLILCFCFKSSLLQTALRRGAVQPKRKQRASQLASANRNSFNQKMIENAFTGTDKNLYAPCILRMLQVLYEAVSWNIEPNCSTKGCFGRGSRPNKTTTKQV